MCGRWRAGGGRREGSGDTARSVSINEGEAGVKCFCVAECFSVAKCSQVADCSFTAAPLHHSHALPCHNHHNFNFAFPVFRPLPPHPSPSSHLGAVKVPVDLRSVPSSLPSPPLPLHTPFPTAAPSHLPGHCQSACIQPSLPPPLPVTPCANAPPLPGRYQSACSQPSLPPPLPLGCPAPNQRCRRQRLASSLHCSAAPENEQQISPNN